MSSDYRIKLLDFRRREPPGYILCRANNRRLCSGVIEYEASFMYEADGKHLRRRIPMCPRHAFSFARKHGLLLPIMTDRARMILEATERNMKYQVRYKDGRVDGPYTIKRVLGKVTREYSLGFARAKEGALFPMEDLEVDDIIAGPVEIYREWPAEDEEAFARIETEEELETTRVNGIAGRKRGHHG